MNKVETNSIKPHKLAFFFPIMAPLVIIFFIIVGVAHFIDVINPVITSAIAFIVLGLIYALKTVEYNKTSYSLTGDKILYKTGSLISDKQVEIPIKNISHLHLQLPFLSHWFFKTGNIHVESAGSNSIEGRIFSVSNSNELYKKIQDLMKLNGFLLEKKELKESLKPAPIAVMFETLKVVGSGIAAMFYLAVNLLVDDDGNTRAIDDSLINIGIVIGVVALISIVIFAVLKYLDLKKRVYKVFNDTITYEEGFLTKNYSLIPFENITDSQSTQTLVDQIFELHDIAVSCAGAKREIKFKNIINGEVLTQNIKVHLKNFKAQEAERKEKIIAAKKNSNEVDTKQTKPTRTQNLKNFNKSYTKEFVMDAARVFMLPAIVAGMLIIFAIVFSIPALIPVIIVFIIFLIIQLIIRACTDYSIETDNINYQFKFLSTKNLSFVNEKITSVILVESIIDKIFGTCQIHFGSIGSSEKIKFKHIKKSLNLFDDVLSKVGFVDDKVLHQLQPNFSILNWLKSLLFVPIIGLLVPIIMIVILAGLEETSFEKGKIITFFSVTIILVFTAIYVYAKAYFKKSNVSLFADYLTVKKGLLVQTQAYANYTNIKDIQTTKYPLTGVGEIKFNVAGEDAQNIELSQQKQLAMALIFNQYISKVHSSHNLSLKFIPNISIQNEVFDTILQKPMDSKSIQLLEKNIQIAAAEPTNIAKPSLKNYMWWQIVLFILFSLPAIFTQEPLALIMPLLFIAPLIIGTIIWVKCISYEIHTDRLVKKFGVFYKKQISLLYTKIDHTNKSQGLINKIFGNGNIAIHTIGSSKLEMEIKNVPEFQDFYNQIQNRL